MLRRELERATSKGDDKAVRRSAKKSLVCGGACFSNRIGSGGNSLTLYVSQKIPFIDHAAARRLIAKGREAISSGDGEGLKKVVRGLWMAAKETMPKRLRERRHALRSS